MYEILLKWALETVQKIGLDYGNAEASLIMEAMKIKNSMVLRRFDFAWNSCQALVALSQRIDKSIADLSRKPSDPDLVKSVFNLHNEWYFEYKKLRPQFEAINDLLSYYSLHLGGALETESICRLLEQSGKPAEMFVTKDYHRFWYFSSAIMLALVRITSTDLRFWLSETDYSQVADKWSYQDVQNMKDHIMGDRRTLFLLRLERPGELDRFWKEVEEYNRLVAV